MDNLWFTYIGEKYGRISAYRDLENKTVTFSTGDWFNKHGNRHDGKMVTRVLHLGYLDEHFKYAGQKYHLSTHYYGYCN